MRRRDFLSLAAAGAAVTFPWVAFAQQTAKVPRVVYLYVEGRPNSDAFRQGLVDFGYTEGKNIQVEFLSAPSAADVAAYVARAVASRPDILVADGAPAAVAAKGATSDISIVFTNLADPVSLGLVSNLARPGGNLTGNTVVGPALAVKTVEILEEIIPSLSRIALFETSANPSAAVLRDELAKASPALHVVIVPIEVKNQGEDFVPYFEQARKAGAQALFIAGYLANDRQSEVIYSLSSRYAFPAVATIAVNMENGGLLAYGVNNAAVVRRSAFYVDAILKGTPPGALAIELPTMFELVVNARAAKSLGLTVPPSVLLRADRVIE